MACSDGGQRAVEVALDGADRDAGCSGDLGKLHLVDEAEKEDGALPLGEARDGLPDEGHLLGGDEAGVRARVGMRKEGGDLCGVDGGGGGPSPELEALGAGVVAEEVEGDSGEPGGDGALATEGVACGPGAEEGLLGEGVGEIGFAEAGEQEAEDSLLVSGHDTVEVIEGCCLRERRRHVGDEVRCYGVSGHAFRVSLTRQTGLGGVGLQP